MEKLVLSEVRWILKIVLCGPSMVGKTCLSTRYVNGVFARGTKQTIGVDFALKNVTIDQETDDIPKGREITLQIWDFAGEERFKNVLPLYVGGTQGLLLAFDLTRPETLKALPTWLEVIRPHIDPSVPIILIGMKNDLEQQVTKSEIDELVQTEKCDFFKPTSSLTGFNVEEIFNLITKEILERRSPPK